MTKTLLSLVALLGCLYSSTSVCLARHVSFAVSTQVVEHSNGWNSTTEELLPAHCLKKFDLGDEGAGNESKLGGGLLIDSKAMQAELGMSANLRAHFGLANADISAAAQFVQNSLETNDSLAYILEIKKEVNTKYVKLNENLQITKTDDFEKTCGDYFVRSITYGGKLFLLVKMQFSTSSEKQAFKVELDGSLSRMSLDGSLRMQAAFDKLKNSKNVSLYIEAYQLSGSVALASQAKAHPLTLSRVLGRDDDSTVNPFFSCASENLGKCFDFATKFQGYAKQFENDIYNYPAPLRITTESWDSIPNFRQKILLGEVDLEIKRARLSFIDALDQELITQQELVRAQRLATNII